MVLLNTPYSNDKTFGFVRMAWVNGSWVVESSCLRSIKDFPTYDSNFPASELSSVHPIPPMTDVLRGAAVFGPNKRTNFTITFPAECDPYAADPSKRPKSYIVCKEVDEDYADVTEQDLKVLECEDDLGVILHYKKKKKKKFSLF